ncbi:MAG: InlB B-repeat-containing protein [Gloeobacteraceae cyanobacterium ES-bin-144]|nr:InlB B-repeat-containing protein [Verrucomicrobiales bacterium]
MKPNTLPRKFAVMMSGIASVLLMLSQDSVQASIAYGSINNFDCVNDTGTDCHGFEIELEDCHSTDISYTYNYNHYGVPKITEDNSVAGHPKCVIRWESKKNADGTWAAYTAIPSGPIAATNGHMFTNPAVNFGGEHFGAGFRAQPTAIRYNWLIDQGGALVRGGAVQVSTPTFTYFPPVAAALPAVQAVIAPPPPPAPEPKEFGKAVWVKEIRTTTHNNNEVKLRDLISDDPEDLNDKNWRNGEPDEVETEWQVLQKDYHKADAPNNQLAAAAEELPNADEVVTRRYEFYKYTGPLDIETGEAMAQSVAADGIHGVGVKLINGVEVDLATVEIVGAFTGSQMAAVDVDAPVGLIDHVGEGEVNVPFAARTVVVEGGVLGFTSTITGALPASMDFDVVTGVLSGTPTVSGEFLFTITANDGVNPEISKTYTLRVAAEGKALPPESLVDTSVSPPDSGTTTGDGSFASGADVTVTAAAAVGYHFVNWTDNGKLVATSTSHTFAIDVNHSLVANFSNLPQWNIATSASPAEGGGTSGGGLVDDGSSLTVVASPNAGYSFVNWTDGGTAVSSSASYIFPTTAHRTLVANFMVTPTYAVNVSASPAIGGTTSGGGNYPSATSATVVAVESPGYVFAGWEVGSTLVSNSASYTFTVTSNMTLVANFVLAGVPKSVVTSANSVAGGSVSGNGTYLTGVIATVVASSKPGYQFSKWQEGSATVSTSPNYSFTVTADRTLVAKFNEFFVVTATTSPIISGRTEIDSISYKTGEIAQAKAFPAAGWNFENWTENGNIVSSSSTYEFTIASNRALVAHFTWNAGVTVTTTSSTQIGGTTTGDGPYSNGDDVTVSALPEAGYAFLRWTENETEVSTDPDYVFTAAANRRLVAKFAPYLNIVASALPASGGVVSGDGLFIAGDTAYLTTTATPGYIFQGWTENGTSVSTLNSYNFIVNGVRDLVANFVMADVPTPIDIQHAPAAGVAFAMEWSLVPGGWILEESPDMTPGSWIDTIRPDTPHDGLHHVEVTDPAPQKRFFRLKKP